MAVLDQLKLTNATPRREASPVERFRRRLVDAIQLQIELANADLAGRPLNLKRENACVAAAIWGGADSLIAERHG